MPEATRKGLNQAAVATATPRHRDAVPNVAPPGNLPVPMADVEREQADKARAAIAGTQTGPTAEPGRAAADSTEAEAESVSPRASRFRRPSELDFEFTPPERREIRNTNVPLTVGLLFSIVASFVIFIVSLMGGAAGEDPIMPSFWRALAALAMLTTLSFAASWFMPAPSGHRWLLDRIEAEERLAEDVSGPAPAEQPDPPAERAPEMPTPEKGGSVDYFVADEDGLDEDEDDDSDEEMPDEDLDEFDEENDEDDLLPAITASAPAEQRL